MNPDQESTSVNDPYEISITSHNRHIKSQYGKEQVASPPSSSSPSRMTEGPDKTCFITMSSSSTNLPSHIHQRGRHPSKELFTIHQDEFYSKNLFIASTLVVTYLIEVTVQILLIVQCCRSFQQLDLVTDETATTEAGVKLTNIPTSTASWSWFLVISSVLSSLLVTLISIIWVFRGMDFSGRHCGRLLCYVMHSFLLGLLWRYLKLAFAYDKADLEEFFKLRTIQTYIQSLPLVTIHLAWVLMTQLPSSFHQYPADSYHALSSWLVVAEMLSAVTSLIVLSSIVSTTTFNNSQGVVPSHNNTSLGETKQRTSPVKVASGCAKGDNNPNHQFNDSGTASTDNQATGNGMRLMTTIKMLMSHYSRNSGPGRALLLISRLISLGMLVFEMNYWTGFITLLHLAVCFVWLGLWTRLCARIVGSSKLNRSKMAKSNENCDGNSCSNDSGLVKSEIMVTSGIPVLPDTVQMVATTASPDHLEYTISSEYTVEDITTTQGRLNSVSSSPSFPNCLSVVIHRSNNANPGNNDKKDNGMMKNVGCCERKVLLRVLSLTYILFWDLSSSPLACSLSNRLNLWATALPVLLTLVENVSITIFHWRNQQNMILSGVSGTCLVFGWLLVAAYQFHSRQRQQSLKKQQQYELQQQQEQQVENDDSAHGRGRNYVGSNNKRGEKSVNKKEAGDCLSLCCSSLSHPLNIKRKGYHQQEHNFCNNDKMACAAMAEEQNHHHDVTVIYNDYQEQQDLGKLMNCSKNKARSNSGRSKGAAKNSIVFPDLGIASDHTGVVGGGELFSEDNNDGNESMIKNGQRYQENVMACAKPASTSNTPVTNNYTNIKEALTRRISNKSCSSSLKKQQHRMNQDRESVKGEVEGVANQLGEPISSFKSSSPSSRLHPPTTNSNKCMPISIKSPISWLPETCCNDSSGSSNSRNTNTLSEPRFYCPENYTDLDNNNEIDSAKRTVSGGVVGNFENGCDSLPVVFFEGRGGTTRSYKQKQSRPALPTAAAIAVLRTARSANATPVASSNNKFPLDMRQVRQEKYQQQQHPPERDLYPEHSHHHQYNYDDDPIERASKGTRRNQIMGKTYLSDGASLTSLDGLCEIRASTPVEIKKASRVIVNYPPPHHQISDSKTVSRCLCKVDGSSGSPGNNRKCPVSIAPTNMNNDEAGVVIGTSGNNNNIYEKLIDDSYGILICEGENTPRQSGGAGAVVAAVNRKKCSNACNNVSSGCIVNSNSNQIVGCSSELDLGSSCRRPTAGVHVPSQKLRILCAKCLENHDPLLTNCEVEVEVDHHQSDDNDEEENEQGDHYHYENNYTSKNHYDPSSITIMRNMRHDNWQQQKRVGSGGGRGLIMVNKSLPQLVSHSPFPYTPAESDTTDYPSDTEFTNNVVEDDGQSLSTHFSSATCTWHHNHFQPTQLSQFIWAASSMMPNSSVGGAQQFPKEFTSLEYVRTWLMASHPRTYAINNHINNSNNNTHHLPHRHHHHNHQQENSISTTNDINGSSSIQKVVKGTTTPKRINNNSNSCNRHSVGRNDKGLASSSSPASISLKNKSCDKTISKKKRFRQLEKRQRPIGRGASPPAKEVCSTTNNSIEATTTATAAATTSDTARFQPPPSRKQHPLLVYDMIPRQEQEKPLSATSHKKCRDQLDLFHKELETVV